MKVLISEKKTRVQNLVSFKISGNNDFDEKLGFSGKNVKFSHNGNTYYKYHYIFENKIIERCRIFYSNYKYRNIRRNQF